MNLHQAMRDYVLTEHIKVEVPEDFDDDYNLIDAGYMDSLAIVSTIRYLERHYQLPINEGDIVPEHFVSMNALVAFVLRKQEQAAAS